MNTCDSAAAGGPDAAKESRSRTSSRPSAASRPTSSVVETTHTRSPATTGRRTVSCFGAARTDHRRTPVFASTAYNRFSPSSAITRPPVSHSCFRLWPFGTVSGVSHTISIPLAANTSGAAGIGNARGARAHPHNPSPNAAHQATAINVRFMVRSALCAAGLRTRRDQPTAS